MLFTLLKGKGKVIRKVFIDFPLITLFYFRKSLFNDIIQGAIALKIYIL